MAVTVRFAPSPTGFLHIGNLRPALFNRLFASGAGDRFILRLDDTDRERSKDEYAEAIREDLGWIGIGWDEFHRQSDRLDRYADAADVLRAKGLLYACYETAEELDTRRRLLLAERRPPIYGRAALRLTEEDHRRFAAEGRRPHWRFLLPNHDGDPFRTRRTEVRWDDLVRGPQQIDLASLSDPVLVREDATPLYTFTSVVDDAEMGISHVIRGEDHLTNTAVQIALFEALGADLPVFAHHNLLTTVDGEGLSKRSGALSLRTLRGEGYEPMAVASLAALTGAAGAVEALPDLAALAERFDLAAVSRSSAKFDPDDLGRLNGEIVHAMPVETARPRLEAMGVPERLAAPFWLAVRGNCERVGDAEQWWKAVSDGPLAAGASVPADGEFLRLAAELLPAEPFDASTWKGWTEALKSRTGLKGRDLFLPLRRALTGHEHGPELAALLPLIGRDRALERLGR